MPIVYERNPGTTYHGHEDFDQENTGIGNAFVDQFCRRGATQFVIVDDGGAQLNPVGHTEAARPAIKRASTRSPFAMLIRDWHGSAFSDVGRRSCHRSKQLHAYIDGAATSQPVMFVRPLSLSNVCPELGAVACSGVTVTLLQVSPLMLRRRI